MTIFSTSHDEQMSKKLGLDRLSQTIRKSAFKRCQKSKIKNPMTSFERKVMYDGWGSSTAGRRFKVIMNLLKTEN